MVASIYTMKRKMKGLERIREKTQWSLQIKQLEERAQIIKVNPTVNFKTPIL